MQFLNVLHAGNADRVSGQVCGNGKHVNTLSGFACFSFLQLSSYDFPKIIMLSALADDFICKYTKQCFRHVPRVSPRALCRVLLVCCYNHTLVLVGAGNPACFREDLT
jgi:hypothetical protein